MGKGRAKPISMLPGRALACTPAWRVADEKILAPKHSMSLALSTSLAPTWLLGK